MLMLIVMVTLMVMVMLILTVMLTVMVMLMMMLMLIVMVMVIKRAVYIVCIINYDQIPPMVYGQVLAGHLPAVHLLARRKLATDI